MNKSMMVLTTSVMAMFTFLMIAGCEKNDPATVAGINVPKEAVVLGNEISPEELGHILRIREEEKLSRDVYVDMYNRWQYRVFNNIQASEQFHMNAMLRIMNKYSIGDPVGDNDTGVFTDPALQTLYDDYIERGSVSAKEAIAVGVTIEDMDIANIEAALAVTDNEDIRKVYENLLEASKQHLRSFTAHPGTSKNPISQ